MRYAVDTNIIAAAIMRGGLSRKLIFSRGIIFYAPEFIGEELDEHRDKFIALSKLDEETYDKACEQVLANIHIIEEKEYAHRKGWAKQVSPDKDDWPFLALAWQKACPLWSNDKRLKKQNEIIVYDTAELAGMLGVRETHGKD